MYKVKEENFKEDVVEGYASCMPVTYPGGGIGPEHIWHAATGSGP